MRPILDFANQLEVEDVIIVLALRGVLKPITGPDAPVQAWKDGQVAFEYISFSLGIG